MAAPDITAAELRRRLAADDVPFVLDVRETFEVDEWAFPGALNIPLGELAARAGELPSDRTIVVVCHSGVRSASAADALERGGWAAANLAGGAVAWQQSEPD